MLFFKFSHLDPDQRVTESTALLGMQYYRDGRQAGVSG